MHVALLRSHLVYSHKNTFIRKVTSPVLALWSQIKVSEMGPTKLSVGFSIFGNEKIILLHYNRIHKIYIIGTNHTDSKYPSLVQRVIEDVKPDVVGVELCRTRVGYKNSLSAGKSKFKEFNFKSIPDERLRAAIGEKLRLLYAYGAIQYEESQKFRQVLRGYRTLRTYKLDKIIRANNLPVGAELYVPFRNYQWHSTYRLGPKYLHNFNVEYKILLLDRPIADTYRNLARALKEKEKILVKIYKRNFAKYFRDGYGTLMENIWSHNTAFRRIFINQRDEHMASMIYDAVAVHRFPKLVCIVGKSHTEGIIKYLKKKLDGK